MYCYVFTYYYPWLDLSWDSLSLSLCVSTIMGDSLVVDLFNKSCVVTIRECDTQVDLIVLDMVSILQIIYLS